MLEMIKNPDDTINWKNVAIGVVGLFVTVGAGTGLGYYLRGASGGDEASCRLLLDPLRANYNDCVVLRDRALGDLQRAIREGADGTEVSRLREQVAKLQRDLEAAAASLDPLRANYNECIARRDRALGELQKAVQEGTRDGAEVSRLREQVEKLQKDMETAGAAYQKRLHDAVTRVIGLKDRQSALMAEIGPLDNRRQGLFRTMALVIQKFSSLALQLPLYMNWTRFRVERDGSKTDVTETTLPLEGASTLRNMVIDAWGMDRLPDSYFYEAPSGASWSDLPPSITSDRLDVARLRSFSDQIDAYRPYGLESLTDAQKGGLFMLWHYALIIFAFKAAIDNIDGQVTDKRNEISRINNDLGLVLRA